MIYENFFKWLFRDRRKHCEHDWVDTGYTYSEFREMFSDTGFRHLWKCKKCGAKEKRTPQNPPSNYILW